MYPPRWPSDRVVWVLLRGHARETVVSICIVHFNHVHDRAGLKHADSAIKFLMPSPVLFL